MYVIEQDAFEKLFGALKKRKYEVIGPRLQDGAIVYGEVHSSKDLPVGWGDRQDAGIYRLQKRKDNAYFGYVVGPDAWKKFLYPPQHKLWEAKRAEDTFHIQENKDEKRIAFLGVRSCELAAIRIHDKVFLGGSYTDTSYKRRRANALIIAVNCTQPGGTCFCASMKTGPKVNGGFDLCLTEVLEKDRHYLIIESGSRRGEDILEEISHRPACKDEEDRVNVLMEKAGNKMGRQMKVQGLKDALLGNPEHPRWDQIARRCLSCANCTMVCPTCFCSTVEDVGDLTGDHAERWRRWDSCFTQEFSYIHGGYVRHSVKARYRQWMTHKLATWYDQFGTSGCVGCGRCISWCPVGIDITEEVKTIEGGKR